MKKQDSPGEKKSKKPIIIAVIVSVLLIAAALSAYFFFFRNKLPETILSDSEFLLGIKSWEKVDAPTVIWSFEEPGKGELTTNKTNYYDMLWNLDGDVLKIDTKWLYELENTFLISINREEKKIILTNQDDGTISVFVPLGTQASAEEKPSETQEEATP